MYIGLSKKVYDKKVNWEVLKAERPETIVYKAFGGRELKLYVFRPQERNAPFPAVLFYHGGGWERESPARLFPHAAYAALRGAVGICAEYRLMDNETLSIRDCIRDCFDAALYMIKHAEELGIDRNRLISFGDSAGAYLAAVLGCAKIAGRFTGVYKPLVAHTVFLNGIADLTGKWSCALFKGGITGGPDDDGRREKLAEARALSPLFNISAGDAGTLIYHGQNDSVTEQYTAEEYYCALSEAGVNVELTLLPETKHAFILPDLYHPNEYCADILEKIFNRLTLFNTI